MNRTNSLICFCLLCLGLLSGCGYTTSSVIVEDAKSIHVNNIVNSIPVTDEVTDKRMYIAYRSGMELTITKDIIDRFVTDGNLSIQAAGNSDLVLDGELIDFRKDALRYDSADNVIEFRLMITVRLMLLNARTNDIVFDKAIVTGETTYRTTGQFTISESQAIQNAVTDLSIRVVDKIVEGW